MKKSIALYLNLLLLMSACNYDVVTRHYDSYQEAQEQQLFLKGWLPDIIPNSSTDIVTKNDVDLSTSHGHFNIAEHDLAAFKDQLIKISENRYNYQKANEPYRWVFSIKKNTYISYELTQL